MARLLCCYSRVQPCWLNFMPMAEFPLYRDAFSGLPAMSVGICIARFGEAPLAPSQLLLVSRRLQQAQTG